MKIDKIHLFCHCELSRPIGKAWQSLGFQCPVRLLRSFYSLAVTLRHSLPGERVPIGTIRPYTPSPLMGEGEGGGENILTPPTLILPRKGGGDFLSRFAMNSKGISVLFLVIAMLLMITIGYVLSYLIPTKQKSVKFPIYSNQAFFIAQSGVEFAIRYASDQGWRGTTDSGVFDLNRLNSMSRPLGNGTFTISYNNAIGDILTSTGQITGSSENRIVKVSNFTQFLRLIFDPASPAPCRNPSDAPHTPTNRWARFYVKNVRSDSLTLNRFSATWTGGDNLAEIYLGGTLRYSGSVSSPTGIRNFISNQQINSNQIVSVFIYWDKKIDTFSNIIITFYTTGGEGYIFNLDSAGNGLPTC